MRLIQVPLILVVWYSVAIAGTQAGFDTLFGNLPDTVIQQPDPYYVVNDIYVPAGKTVIVKPGVVFLFKNFVGLHVEGVILAKGTPQKPIVFTSEYDHRYNPGGRLDPNPYDWNGIFIHEDGVGSVLEECHVLYTVSGINSQTRFIKITNGVFSHNGRSDCTIEGVQKQPVDSIISYSLSIKDVRKSGVPVVTLRDPQAPLRNAARFGGMTLFLGGTVAGVKFARDYQKWNEERIDLGKQTPLGNDGPLLAAEKNRDQNLALTLTGFGLALLGAAGFTLSFTF